MKTEVPWKKEYKIFGIPDTFEPYPDAPVHSILFNSAKRYPNMGLICNGFRFSYPKVRDHSLRLAAALAGLGLSKGGRVATMLPTSIQFVVADYALSIAGLVHVPVSFLDSVEMLAHKIEQAGPGAIICTTASFNSAIEAVKSMPGIRIIVTDMKDYSESPMPDSSFELSGEYLLMRDIIRNAEPLSAAVAVEVTNDLETLLFTGGTTGVAKGCMLTHRNVYANAIQNSYAVGQLEQSTKGAASVLMGIPFFHSYGHVLMHSMTLLGFNQILIPDPRDSASMIEAIEKYRPVVHVGVPTQFMKLAAERPGKGFNMLALSGSAALPPNVVGEYEEQCGGNIMEGYGLSEMTAVTHLNTSVLARLLGGRSAYHILNIILGRPRVNRSVNFIFRSMGSIKLGKAMNIINMTIRKSFGSRKVRTSTEKRGSIGIPYPDTLVCLRDVETDSVISWEDVLNGRTGELCVSGPQRMLGYWPEPGSGLDSYSYVRTGDIVRVDKKGYFYVVDRVKDMINVSGYKVYSREIDDILAAHRAVSVGAAVGIPDPGREGSERVIVYVQLNQGFGGSVTEKDIHDYLASKVARYAVPRAVKIVDELPLTAMQKVDKKLLRKRACADFEVLP